MTAKMVPRLDGRTNAWQNPIMTPVTNSTSSREGGLRILVMGGTRFLGRHFVKSAVVKGHDVTLFHRGRTSLGLPLGAAHLIGDRERDLHLLRGGHWDVTVDFSAYSPSQVSSLSAALRGCSTSYTYISSIAAYAVPQVVGFTEESALDCTVDSGVASVSDDNYGRLKALSEKAVERAFNDYLIVRPTYVVGPFDYTGRFDYWIRRIARGGEVLTPGPPDAFFQLIDVRDLTDWILRMIERRAGGVYHAAAPYPPVTFGQLLEEIASVAAPEGTQFTWVDKWFLINAGITGQHLPLWPGASPAGRVQAADPSRAVSAGLKPRPLSETIQDLYNLLTAPAAGGTSRVGMTAVQETRLLAEWRQCGHRMSR